MKPYKITSQIKIRCLLRPSGNIAQCKSEMLKK